jgi:hypothetical protein
MYITVTEANRRQDTIKQFVSNKDTVVELKCQIIAENKDPERKVVFCSGFILGYVPSIWTSKTMCGTYDILIKYSSEIDLYIVKFEENSCDPYFR